MTTQKRVLFQINTLLNTLLTLKPGSHLWSRRRSRRGSRRRLHLLLRLLYRCEPGLIYKWLFKTQVFSMIIYRLFLSGARCLFLIKLPLKKKFFYCYSFGFPSLLELASTFSSGSLPLLLLLLLLILLLLLWLFCWRVSLSKSATLSCKDVDQSSILSRAEFKSSSSLSNASNSTKESQRKYVRVKVYFQVNLFTQTLVSLVHLNIR